MALQASRTEMFERAGALVAKVLRGARPADVPVEEPTRYELFVSESAAKALGLTIPASVRARADEVLPQAPFARCLLTGYLTGKQWPGRTLSAAR